MFRDKEEELQRLEQLLAEAEEEEEEFEEEPEEDEFDEEYEEEFVESDFDEEELIREFSGDDDDDPDPAATQMFPTHRDIRVYNTDKSDVDLDGYSDEVFSGRRKPVLPWVFAALTVVVLLVLYLALKQGGYLG